MLKTMRWYKESISISIKSKENELNFLSGHHCSQNRRCVFQFPTRLYFNESISITITRHWKPTETSCQGFVGTIVVRVAAACQFPSRSSAVSISLPHPIMSELVFCLFKCGCSLSILVGFVFNRTQCAELGTGRMSHPVEL